MSPADINKADKVKGFYSQAYHDLVQPNQVWSVQKYFLRRWAPYLSPTRFWAIVAARQLAYRCGKTKTFTAYDGQMAKQAQLSRAHYRRIKGEMAEGNSALALFLRREPTTYHTVKGVTRPEPTTYHVRLDTPLTPADAQHLAEWMKAHSISNDVVAVVSILQNAQELPHQQLLAPQLSPALKEQPETFQAVTITDVVAQCFGKDIAHNPLVREAAEALHTRLTGDLYIGRDYFRTHWLGQLKAGPAYLLTYLRSFCFFNETTGELRNQLTVTLPELADKVGTNVRTLSRWLKTLVSVVQPQAVPPFIKLISKVRTPSNEVTFTYEIGMLTPLVEADLQQYRTTDGQNALYTMLATSQPNGQNDPHKAQVSLPTNGQNDTHGMMPKNQANGQNEPNQLASDGQNASHPPTLADKMRVSKRQNEHARRTKCASFKHYTQLLQALGKDKENFFFQTSTSALWKTEDNRGLQSVAVAVADNLDTLFDELGIDLGPARQRMLAQTPSREQVVAWYLYAINQPSISNPTAYTISRIAAGHPPMNLYVRLAGLSWELWRCYACILDLPLEYRQLFRDAPCYTDWMRLFGRTRPETLPFRVGQDLTLLTTDLPIRTELVSTPAGVEKTGQTSSVVLQDKWQIVLDELKLRLGRTMYNQWLGGSQLTHIDDTDTSQIWTVSVRDPRGVEWLTQRLNQPVIQPTARSINNNKTISIHYVHQT